jgi:hypothetical protein
MAAGKTCVTPCPAAGASFMKTWKALLTNDVVSSMIVYSP